MSTGKILAYINGDGEPLVRKMLALSSAEDPASTPFKSKYAAREVINEIRSAVSSIAEEAPDDETTIANLVLGGLDYFLGANYVVTEELGEGERTLNRALAAIESVGFTRESVATLVATLNQLGILWSERSDAEKAFQLFERARAGYVSFKSTVDESAAAPYPIGSHLVSHLANTGESDSLEVAHTQTLFYLAQVHMMLNDNAQGAKYCGETLLRQLKTRSSASFDPLQWAINAAGMCNFFLGDEAWPQAMHCLQAADAMFSSLDSHPPNSEELQCRRAEVARNWAVFVNALLRVSRNRLFDDVPAPLPSPPDPATLALAPDFSTCLPELRTAPLYTSALALAHVAETPEHARALFHMGQERTLSALDYYALDGFVTEHVALVQAYSQLLNFLAAFEADLSVRAKALKKRANLIEPLIEQLSVQHYIATLRQLYFECAEIYSSLMETKMSALEQTQSDQSETKAAIAKINTYISRSVQWYSRFYDSLCDATGQLPSDLEPLYVKPMLSARFGRARLWTKFLGPPNKRMELLQTNKAYLDYKFIVEYCDAHPDYHDSDEQLAVCREVIELLPQKMQSLLLLAGRE